MLIILYCKSILVKIIKIEYGETMKKLINSIMVILLSIAFSGCNGQLKIPKEDLQHTYYTQTNMWFKDANSYGGTEDDRIIAKHSFYSVNYKYDKFIPVNTKIKILRITHNTIFIEIKNNIYAFVRTRQSKGKNLTQLFKRTFNQAKINLNSSSLEIKEHILSGKIKVGMTKEEVIIARGFPPEHKTKSLKNHTWYYFDTKRNKIIINFKNNKLNKINY